jgi:hypothetical protein
LLDCKKKKFLKKSVYKKGDLVWEYMLKI